MSVLRLLRIMMMIFGTCQMVNSDVKGFEVTIMLINVRSINKNLGNLEAIIIGLESHYVIAFGETWITKLEVPKMA